MLLGKVLLRQGDAPAAEAAFRLCLATREERLGLQHPDTALALLGGLSQLHYTSRTECNTLPVAYPVWPHVHWLICAIKLKCRLSLNSAADCK